MKKTTVFLLVFVLITAASFSMVGSRRLAGGDFQEAASLARQTEFARFIQQIGFSDEQLVKISELVDSTRSAIAKAHEEGIALMEQALEEAIAGNVEQSRQTERNARALISETRTFIQEYLDSMRETVTVAQQERMFSLAGSRMPFNASVDSRFDRSMLQQRLGVIVEPQAKLRIPGHDGRSFDALGKQSVMSHARVLAEKTTVRYPARVELSEAFGELPLRRLFEMIPEREREIVEERLRGLMERVERLLPDREVLRKTRFDAICLTFLLEENAEILRRIAEQ